MNFPTSYCWLAFGADDWVLSHCKLKPSVLYTWPRVYIRLSLRCECMCSEQSLSILFSLACLFHLFTWRLVRVHHLLPSSCLARHHTIWICLVYSIFSRETFKLCVRVPLRVSLSSFMCFLSSIAILAILWHTMMAQLKRYLMLVMVSFCIFYCRAIYEIFLVQSLLNHPCELVILRTCLCQTGSPS